jgi:hypothetical protein
MKPQFKTFFICLIMLASLPSCMVTKCRYSRGWNVGINLNSVARQDQSQLTVKPKTQNRKSARNTIHQDTISSLDSMQIPRADKLEEINDSFKRKIVQSILNPQAAYAPVLQTKKVLKFPKVKQIDFLSHLQNVVNNDTQNESSEDDETGGSYEWLIIVAPLVLALIFLAIPPLAVIGVWIIAIYAAIIYCLINDMFDFDLSWFTFFVQ